MDNSEKLRREDYARAESFLPWYVEKRVYNAEVKPNWIKKGEDQLNKFWYLNKGKNGRQFKLVDVENDYVETAFHHVRLAAALSRASGQYFEANQLPFESIEWLEEENKIRFEFEKQTWECDLESYECQQVEGELEKNPAHLVSPDGKWAAFLKKFNMYVLNLETGEEIQLTKDGKQYFDYGTSPETNTLGVTARKFAGMIPPFAIWSPDSKKLLTQQIDQRKVKELHLLQHVPPEGQRPVVHSYRYSMPGDKEIAKVNVTVLDVEERKAW